eukprot:366070-Chlamydomonas_euryale.AAC.1
MCQATRRPPRLQESEGDVSAAKHAAAPTCRLQSLDHGVHSPAIATVLFPPVHVSASAAQTAY